MAEINTDVQKLSSLTSTLRTLSNSYQNNIDSIYEIIEKLPQDNSWVGNDAESYSHAKNMQKTNLDDFGSSLKSFTNAVEQISNTLGNSINKVRRY